ncbi:prophage antirepressor [Anoxybacillus gonensis]|nr:BRO family protein [Anoxybacillus gonensis]EMI11503.1 prophage antirepressor [Anoxybacillus gonensis]
MRTLQKDGEVWFVAKDVAEALGYSSTGAMNKRLDEDEKTIVPIWNGGYQTNISIITESGLYSAIIGSKKPEAKQFKKWVTSEVLPSIRKNGGYIAGQEQLSPEELMAKL